MRNFITSSIKNAIRTFANEARGVLRVFADIEPGMFYPSRLLTAAPLPGQGSTPTVFQRQRWPQSVNLTELGHRSSNPTAIVGGDFDAASELSGKLRSKRHTG